MTVDSAFTYAYADASGTQKYTEGAEVVDRGDWDSATTYSVSDVVSFSNALYICLQTNQNVSPPSDPDFWSSFVVVNMQETPPVPPSLAEIDALYKSDFGNVSELRADTASIAGIVWVNRTADDGSQEGAFFRRAGIGDHDGVNIIVRYDNTVYTRCV